MSANLTTKHVMAIAGVSHMTVYVWRQGTATRDALPTVEDKKRPNAVLFRPTTLKAWAKKHGVELLYDPVGVADGSVKLKLTTKALVGLKLAAKKAKKRTRH